MNQNRRCSTFNSRWTTKTNFSLCSPKGNSILNEDYVERRISIAFRPKDGMFKVTDAAIKRDPEWISDISALWSGQSTRNRFVKDFINNLRGSRKLDEKEEDDLVESIDHLFDVQNTLSLQWNCLNG